MFKFNEGSVVSIKPSKLTTAKKKHSIKLTN